MNPCELTMSVTAIANALAKNLCDDDLLLAAAIFSQLGDTLATIAAQRAICCNSNSSAPTAGKY